MIFALKIILKSCQLCYCFRMNHLTKELSFFWRGWGILAVITAHWFAYLPGIYAYPWGVVGVSLDQLGRVTVPLFLFLSGYGLGIQYKEQTPTLHRFISRRLWPLIPLFVLWSVTCWLSFAFIPAWKFAGQPSSFVWQLLLGQADYPYYFVVILIQLYFIFPFLLSALKRWSWFMGGVLGLQFLIYGVYALATPPEAWWLERLQYLFVGSWGAYFLFGAWYAIQKRPLFSPKVLFLTGVGAYILCLLDAAWALQQGVDPLLAVRTTRLSVMFYALCLLSCIAQFSFSIPTFFRPIVWLGKHSLLIFLTHALVLRWLFSWWRMSVAPSALFAVGILWGIAFVVSLALSRSSERKQKKSVTIAPTGEVA